MTSRLQTDAQTNSPSREFLASQSGTVQQVMVHQYPSAHPKAARMDIIEMDNGRLRLALLPGRGMGVWKIWVDGVEMGWRSPVRGPVHPMYVPLFDPSGLGWLEGFDEALCRCGLISNGAPEFDDAGHLRFPLHGRIANLPAEQLEITQDPDTKHASVSGVVRETRFLGHQLSLHSQVTLHPSALCFDVCDVVTNHASAPVDIQLLYHYNLGQPVLEAGSELLAPTRAMQPRDAEAASGAEQWSAFDAPRAGFQEQVFFTELHSDAAGQSAVLLKNRAGTLGASVHFNVHQLPCFTLWKNTAAMTDGYVVGLEPGTNYPNTRSSEREANRCVSLAPGAQVAFKLRFAFQTNAADLAEVEQHIRDLVDSKKAQRQLE